MESNAERFTISDIESCWTAYKMTYFLDILNGEYALNDAREDLRGMVGTKYDLRVANKNREEKSNDKR